MGSRRSVSVPVHLRPGSRIRRLGSEALRLPWSSASHSIQQECDRMSTEQSIMLDGFGATTIRSTLKMSAAGGGRCAVNII
jgi:hypothetical protein